eukprot:TRINITY_DN4958_c0_g1_i1.p1 TRINITY_DN4958_c0_g1~~TRINITY_DN4958_c0_g1_i1.p1  ORF type:complete len:237 (+),score=32.63 TRINITY_DN4958_c0_g1_i1:328-1038(+)
MPLVDLTASFDAQDIAAPTSTSMTTSQRPSMSQLIGRLQLLPLEEHQLDTVLTRMSQWYAPRDEEACCMLLADMHSALQSEDVRTRGERTLDSLPHYDSRAWLRGLAHAARSRLARNRHSTSVPPQDSSGAGKSGLRSWSSLSAVRRSQSFEFHHQQQLLSTSGLPTSTAAMTRSKPTSINYDADNDDDDDDNLVDILSDTRAKLASDQPTIADSFARQASPELAQRQPSMTKSLP